MGLMMRIASAFAFCVLIAAAHDPDDVVEEMMEVESIPAEKITRECFRVTATPEGQVAEKMTCTQTPLWTMLETQAGSRLVSSQTVQHIPGMLDVVQHKKKVNPAGVITIAGIPAKASPQMQKAMKQQDDLLNKVTRLEKIASVSDPLEKKQRINWLKLANKVKSMQAGPNKMKSEHVLMKLAKHIGDAEKDLVRQQKMHPRLKVTPSKSHMSKSTPRSVVKMKMNPKVAKALSLKKKIEAKILAIGGKALLRKVQKAAAKRLKVLKPKMHLNHGWVKPVSKKTEYIHGIPVGHQKCFERACVKKEANGTCGAMVISCGVHGKPPRKSQRTKLSKKAALFKIKKLIALKKKLAQAGAVSEAKEHASHKSPKASKF
jgi:hypothetical protein